MPSQLPSALRGNAKESSHAAERRISYDPPYLSGALLGAGSAEAPSQSCPVVPPGQNKSTGRKLEKQGDTENATEGETEDASDELGQLLTHIRKYPEKVCCLAVPKRRQTKVHINDTPLGEQGPNREPSRFVL